MHQVTVGMQHVVPAKVPAIVEMLNRRRLVYFSGYPSVVHSLARIALDLGLELLPGNRPRVVVMGAENTFDHQRRDIERWAGATITDQYGFSEGCGNASACTAGRYHEDHEFGVLECVPEGTEVASGTHGRIVCTGFLSPEFPFIRYEIGDVGTWHEPGDACACGRATRTLARIDGRIDDCVVTPEGHRVMRFDYLFKDTTSIKECQVVQTHADRIILRIVRRDDYRVREEDALRAHVAELVSPTLGVDFEYVDEIPRTRSGKFKAVVSTLGAPSRTRS
jgi:phenylacetate-CoA ligase